MWYQNDKGLLAERAFFRPFYLKEENIQCSQLTTSIYMQLKLNICAYPFFLLWLLQFWRSGFFFLLLSQFLQQVSSSSFPDWSHTYLPSGRRRQIVFCWRLLRRTYSPPEASGSTRIALPMIPLRTQPRPETVAALAEEEVVVVELVWGMAWHNNPCQTHPGTLGWSFLLGRSCPCPKEWWYHHHWGSGRSWSTVACRTTNPSQIPS